MVAVYSRRGGSASSAGGRGFGPSIDLQTNRPKFNVMDHISFHINPFQRLAM